MQDRFSVVLRLAAVPALILGALPAAAQQHFDIVGSGGANLDTNSSVFSSPFGGISSGREAVLINPGFSIVNFGPARLSAEVPFVWTPGTSGSFLGTNYFSTGSTWSVTPGARVNFKPDARFSPFAAFGAGITRTTQSSAGGFSIPNDFITDSSPHLTLGYGGGLDLRLAGPLKIRAELRNFSVNAYGVWENRPVFFGGVGIQF